MQINKINKYESRRQELINYSNAVLIHSVKEKLKIPKFIQKIPEDKSTDWNYQIDIDYLKKMNEENISILNKKVGSKEREINLTETNFKEYEIDSNNYIPMYIRELELNEKDKVKISISSKIKEVNLAFSQRAKNQKEMKNFLKIENNNSNNAEDPFSKKNDLSNLFLTPLNPLKLKTISNKKKREKNNLPVIEETEPDLNEEKKEQKKELIESTNNISKKRVNKIKINYSPIKYHYMGNNYKTITVSNEDKFRNFRSQFDEKLNEILGPSGLIKLKKKKEKI